MLATLATLTLAVVVQDQTPLRAAPSASATTHAQLLQGDVLEVRGQRQDGDHDRNEPRETGSAPQIDLLGTGGKARSPYRAARSRDNPPKT